MTTNAVIPQSDAVRSACPHCQAELSPSEIGKLYAGLRKNRRGGRPWPKKEAPEPSALDIKLLGRRTAKRMAAIAPLVDSKQA